MMGIEKFEIDEFQEKINYEKMCNNFHLLNFWMDILEKRKKISSFFEARNYVNVVIYGMGYIGRHLKTQLEQEGIRILYTIDRDTICFEGSYYDICDILSFSTPDVIVVTPVTEYKAIKEKLAQVIKAPVVSIEEVILSI